MASWTVGDLHLARMYWRELAEKGPMVLNDIRVMSAGRSGQW